jgi:hypothetical protein
MERAAGLKAFETTAVKPSRIYCIAGELALIVGDYGVAEHDCLCGNKQIVAADRSAGLFKPGADQAVGCIGGAASKGRTLRAPSTALSCAVSRGDPFVVAP